MREPTSLQTIYLIKDFISPSQGNTHHNDCHKFYPKVQKRKREIKQVTFSFYKSNLAQYSENQFTKQKKSEICSWTPIYNSFIYFNIDSPNQSMKSRILDQNFPRTYFLNFRKFQRTPSKTRRRSFSFFGKAALFAWYYEACFRICHSNNYILLSKVTHLNEWLRRDYSFFIVLLQF